MLVNRVQELRQTHMLSGQNDIDLIVVTELALQRDKHYLNFSLGR